MNRWGSGVFRAAKPLGRTLPQWTRDSRHVSKPMGHTKSDADVECGRWVTGTWAVTIGLFPSLAAADLLSVSGLACSGRCASVESAAVQPFVCGFFHNRTLPGRPCCGTCPRSAPVVAADGLSGSSILR